MLEVTDFEKLNYEYRDPGYWIIHNPFKNGVEEFLNKIQSQSFFEDPNFAGNPFDNLNIADWDECKKVNNNLLKPFYKNILGDNERPYIEESFKGWINLYKKSNLKYKKSAGIPHNDCYDSLEGIVANFWMSDGIESSSTKFYEYSGKYLKHPMYSYNRCFDFSVDPKHEYYFDFVKYNNTLIDHFPNPNENLLNKLGFIYKGEAPAIPWKMTIYEFKNPHTAYIPETVDYRLSSCFLYGRVPHPWFKESE